MVGSVPAHRRHHARPFEFERFSEFGEEEHVSGHASDEPVPCTSPPTRSSPTVKTAVATARR